MSIAEQFETILLNQKSGQLGIFKSGANGGRFATIGRLTISSHYEAAQGSTPGCLTRGVHHVAIYSKVDGAVIHEASSHEMVYAISDVLARPPKKAAA